MMTLTARIATQARAAHLLARADLARELGIRGTRLQWADRAAAHTWAPAARRRIYHDIWAGAANEAGADLRTLDDDFFLLTKGDQTSMVWFHHVQLDDPVSLRLALHKQLMHRLLTEAGVPVPEHRQFGSGDIEPARSYLHDSGGVFVVKPASGTSGGAGVTCSVDSDADLRRAVVHASRLDSQLLIERQVAGDEYRLLFLDGELLDVIRRRPPSVVGDGRLSVVELISAENRRRSDARGDEGMSVLDVTLDSVLTLDRAGLSLRSVPPAGVRVAVRSAANANIPADNVTVGRNEVADTVVAAARRAVEVAHLRLGGVDLITPDISQNLAAVGGAVVEVNGTPGLHYHYLVADPAAATPVAVPVLHALLRSG